LQLYPVYPDKTAEMQFYPFGTGMNNTQNPGKKPVLSIWPTFSISNYLLIPSYSKYF